MVKFFNKEEIIFAKGFCLRLKLSSDEASVSLLSILSELRFQHKSFRQLITAAWK